MSTIGPMFAASANLGLANAERMLKGIAASDFGRFARPGGQVIVSNHPAFICGHLSLYVPKVLNDLQQDASAFEPSAKYEELFSKHATCTDDPDCTIYPGKDELVDRLLGGYQAAAAALMTAPDELFTAEYPDEAMRAKVPTVGAADNFYVGGHFMLHIGQLSAWRRAMGMAPA
ncbi:hypothetical protein K227x_05990 [Rubripirellula lacrimiformis]|uniref:DinB superfamily protein n=1 Tax=Rubripirellula lacrimiformis TaxID=1930273 RepID=A0A517N515_9BACT|nr:DinB family protein [Rubripirellula lacrimiformis]QDT02226.1 hypothetical protein K227x_05990 [Rubripirellula lacrimiformis]